MRTTAYLHFKDDCAEAFQFYAKTLHGTDLRILRQGDMKKDAPEAEKNWVLHAYLKIGETELMASDSCGAPYHKPSGMHVVLNVDSATEAERVFKAFSERGEVTMKMEETFFAHKFGMLVDRFGTPWMVIAQKQMG